MHKLYIQFSDIPNGFWNFFLFYLKSAWLKLNGCIKFQKRLEVRCFTYYGNTTGTVRLHSECIASINISDFCEEIKDKDTWHVEGYAKITPARFKLVKLFLTWLWESLSTLVIFADWERCSGQLMLGVGGISWRCDLGTPFKQDNLAAWVLNLNLPKLVFCSSEVLLSDLDFFADRNSLRFWEGLGQKRTLLHYP